MEESDLKREYDELLAVYSKKRNECDSIEREIKQAKNDIDELKNKLKDCIVPEPEKRELIPSEAQQQQKRDLIRQQQELTNVLTQLQSLLPQSTEQDHAELKGQINSLQALRASLVYKENNEQKVKATALLSDIQPKISEEQKRLQGLQRDAFEQEQRLKSLQKEVDALQGVHYEEQKQNVENGASIADLENMLKTLQQQQNAIAQNLKRQNSNLVEKIKNNELQQQKKKKQLSQLKASNSNLKNTLNKLQEELKKLRSEAPKADNHSQLATLEAAHKSLLREIEDYTKEVTIKKVQATKKKEEAKKQKNKDKKNFKQEILQEQTLNQLLTKQLDREQKKLQNTIKVRKSYVPHENLQILQKQYERQQLKGKPNLQGEQKQREKLIRENQMIKSRISFLTSAGKEMQKQSQRKLKELKEKGDDLVKDKLANQKILSQATYKLNQYLRVYPDHEKKKEEYKNLEKKRRQEIREEQQRKAAERKQEQNEVLIEKALQQDNSQTAWDKWDKWDKAGNLTKADQGSIFNNRQFQIGAAVVAIVAILLLSFS